MNQHHNKILVVDDETVNLNILMEHLNSAGYHVIKAVDGKSALTILDEQTDIDLILLDRMMPNMNGMEVMNEIRSNTRLREIPVIMQTALSSTKEIAEGVKAGVFYYLTKPYDDVVLLSIVKAALEHKEKRNDLLSEIKKQGKTLELLEMGKFHFRTIEDVQNLSCLLANCYIEPDNSALGLYEIMLNAVEHGNLEITYEEKKRLLQNDKNAWKEEVNKRLNLEKYKDRHATLLFENKDDIITLTIQDCGSGFNHAEFSELTPERSTDVNGRGLVIAKLFSFDKIEFIGCGNKVVCTYYKKLRQHDIRFDPNKINKNKEKSI